MNQEGLLFPKEATKKKREKHGKCIMPGDQKGRCYISAVTEVFIDIIYSLEIKIKNGQSDMV